MIDLFLHTYCYRFNFKYNDRFDIFSFIDEAAGFGFGGINITCFPPQFPYLGGDGPDHLKAVRRRIEARGLRVDLETGGTDPDHLARLVDLAAALGADHLRTYTRIGPEGPLAQAARDLAGAADLAARRGIALLVENHEDLTAAEVATLLDRVGHPGAGALFDYGNGMVFMEDPLEGARRLGPWARTAHVKDHVVLPAGAAGNAEDEILGVPLGEGHIPIVEVTRELVGAGIGRLCFENCYGYRTPFRDRRGAAVMGEGAFRHRHPPYDPAVAMVAAPASAGEARPVHMALEAEAVARSVRWMDAAFAQAGIALRRPLQPLYGTESDRTWRLQR